MHSPLLQYRKRICISLTLIWGVNFSQRQGLSRRPNDKKGNGPGNEVGFIYLGNFALYIWELNYISFRMYTCVSFYISLFRCACFCSILYYMDIKYGQLTFEITFVKYTLYIWAQSNVINLGTPFLPATSQVKVHMKQLTNAE